MHIAFVPQDIRQRRGQNDLSTDVVAFSNCVVTLLSLFNSTLGSEAPMSLFLLPSFLSLFSVWFICVCVVLVWSGLPCSMGFDPNYVRDWQCILAEILCRLLFWLLSIDIMRYHDLL